MADLARKMVVLTGARQVGKTTRRLQPHLVNVGKRLAKSPKMYLRDSGVLHALLGIATVRGCTANLSAATPSCAS